MVRMIFAAAWVALLSLASAASAQVIYEPVQYQYVRGGAMYYYGGSDPQVFGLAEYNAELFNAARTMGKGGLTVERVVNVTRTHVYSDLFPYRDAKLMGFTPDDAANEANANLPRYFRKGNLLAAAVPAVSGTYFRMSDILSAGHSAVWTVPAQAEPRAILPAGGNNGPSTAPATSPATEPAPIMIIPKGALIPRHTSDKMLIVSR